MKIEILYFNSHAGDYTVKNALGWLFYLGIDDLPQECKDGSLAGKSVVVDALDWSNCWIPCDDSEWLFEAARLKVLV